MNRILRNLAAPIMLALPMTSVALPIAVGDHEWLAPIETVGIAYNDMAGACDPGTGTCAGTVGAVDLTGWTWAAASEVGDMFAMLSPHPGGSGTYTEAYSDWAPYIIGLFGQTWDTGAARYVSGLTRTSYASRRGSLATGAEVINYYGAYDYRNDSIFSNSGFWQHTRYSTVGHWLYRSASPVPEPGTLLLIAVGIAGMNFTRRHGNKRGNKANSAARHCCSIGIGRLR